MNLYGYPSKEYREIATTIPWMVVHHAQGYETRERNFEAIYQAYLNESIEIGSLAMYLGRMYQMKKGTRLRMKSPYKAIDEINTLISELNLDEKKLKVEKSFESSSASKL